MSEKDIYSIVPEISEKEPAEKANKKKKKLSHRQRNTLIVSLISGAVVVAVVLGIIFGLPLLKKSKNKTYSLSDMPMMYVVDGPGLNYYNYETKKDTLVVSTLIGKDSAMPYVSWAVTADGRSFFFADEYGDLYRNNLYTDQGNNFIAENVSSFSITNSGNLLYLSGNGELIYVCFKADKIGYTSYTVDTDVDSFKCNTEKENAVYIKKSESRSFLYRANLSKKPKTAMILEDCGEFINTDAENLAFLFTQKTDDSGKTSVYLTKSLKKTVLAAENADKIFSMGTDGSLIYGISTGQVIDFNAYFTDSTAADDEQLPEPDYGDVLYNKISSAAFDAQMSRWMEKTTRDTIRDVIAEKNSMSGGYTLYKYENGGSTALDENVTELLAASEDNSVAVYATTKYKSSGQKVICDISDFENIPDAESKINELFLSGKTTYKIFTGSKTVPKEIYTYENKDTTVHLSDDLTGLYIFQKDGDSGVLKYIDIALGNVGEIRDVATDITNLIFKDGNILYEQKSTVVKDDAENDNPDTGEMKKTESTETVSLYRASGVKAVKIGDNVDAETLYIADGIFYYITKDGKLICKNGEAETEIADSATSLYWRGNDKLYYVSYNETNGHSLYVYDGNETHGIAVRLLYVLGM